MAENGRPIPKRDKTRIRVNGPAQLGDDAVASRETHFTDRRTTIKTTEIRHCASCRSAIRSAQEIGGVCIVCEQVVCAECAVSVFR